jgi:hypothetical protein
VDIHRGRWRPLASRHKRSVATDKWLVCVAVRACKLPARGVVAEEIRKDSRFGLAPARCSRADLCCRAFGADNMASQLIREGFNQVYAEHPSIRCLNHGSTLSSLPCSGSVITGTPCTASVWRRARPLRLCGKSLLFQDQNIAQTNHINLPDFRGEPSVGAGHSLRRCPTLAGETDPQTDPRIDAWPFARALPSPVPKAGTATITLRQICWCS